MSDVINLKKKWNHRWKTDPRFIEGFDYEKPEDADTPDSLRWALPLHEAANSPQELQKQKRMMDEAKKTVAAEMKVKRLNSRKLSIAD